MCSALWGTLLWFFSVMPCNPLKGQAVPSFKLEDVCFEITFRRYMNQFQGPQTAVIHSSQSRV